ncbi:MAG: type IX secretion system sortase PorU [Bacteroidales bacterium]|jgi:hypothetical protein
MIKRLYILILTLSFFEYTLAFTKLIKKELSWNIHQEKFSDDFKINLLYFNDATYNEFNLPVFNERIDAESPDVKVMTKLYNETYVPFTDAELKQINNLDKITGDISIKSNVLIERKIPYILVSFVPIRKNPTTNKLEKLVSFELSIEITPVYSAKAGKMRHTYTQNSVLASGRWYKIGTYYNGIYKLTYNDLVRLGIDVTSINPKNIRVYGNGGGMLPEDNSSSRPDDLIENAIFVSGESDGKFDAGDYILFYGQSPHKWSYNISSEKFTHYNNIYSDETYYFLTTDIGAGKRVTVQTSSTSTPTNTVTTFNDFSYHEKDSLNLIKSGKAWYGEYFDLINSYSFSFSFPNIDANSDVRVNTKIAGKTFSGNAVFEINANGKDTIITTGVCSDVEFAKDGYSEMFFKTPSSTIFTNVSMLSSNTTGWLDYIEVNARRNLIMSGNQLSFRDALSTGTGNISEFHLSTSNPNLTIWDITNLFEPKAQETTYNSGALTFRLANDSLKEFIAFNGTFYYTANLLGSVANQNLHSLSKIDFVIVAPQTFLSEANRLAEFRRNNDNFSVAVVSTQQVYNEFSSGSQDVSAIRDFIKMLYDKASSQNELPKYLLLFGDGSYDYKSRIKNNTNYVPAYEAASSLSSTNSYVSDDFYALLDDNEGADAYGYIDVGGGRFPVTSIDEAKNAVDKVIRYSVKYNELQASSNDCSSSNDISNYAEWRNIICFAADDEDDNVHLNQAEQITKYIDATYKNFNIEKIYFDSYKQESTPGGQRYPGVTDAINQKIEKGTLIINYIGHGGQLGWAHERVLEISDINSWKNYYNMPVFITATCEFSYYDNPDQVSAGEYVFLNPSGGGVALFTTTRLAYSQSNYVLNMNFYENAFNKMSDGRYPRLGDIVRLAKGMSGISVNNKIFTILGDPSLEISLPKYEVNTTPFSDTLKALSKVTIQGILSDTAGQPLNNFNGIIYPTVYDKYSTVSTLGQDEHSSITNFKIQKNVLYKGKVSVTNGNYKFTFIVPKDISYQYGNGKLSYYANNQYDDAKGYNKNIIVGGSNNNAPPDNSGPNINLFLNNDKFVFGGITNENPILLAFLSDSNGINTVGNGIGHDVVATIDDNTENSFVLNDFYEASLNSYQKGTIRYQFNDLSEGKHKLKLKVWDTYNNSSEAYTEFIVAKSAEIKLEHVLNYPNPFTTHTSFYFEHNQPCCGLDVQVKIFTVSGKLIKTIDKSVETEGFRVDFDQITWDGTDDYGDKVGRGVYIYHLKVRSNNGSVAEKYEKLVIL